MRRIAVAILAVVILAAWWITAPSVLTAAALLDYAPDPAAGERIFWAGGCASCHAGGEDQLLLGGGMALESPYGTFIAPNISPHEEDGIGRWTALEFVNAMLRGVSPDGRHYYPSFPYTSYARMAVTDVLDLQAYLETLQAVPGTAAAHDLGFPWSVRRGIGAWKRLYLDDAPVLDLESENALVRKGRQLVEGVGHCGECHTPRGRFGNLLVANWLGGAPDLEGEGRVPNITPAGKTISSWSARDIEYYLESGFTPDFDTVGGSMVAVQENMARLTAADRRAIAAYLKALPAVD